MHQLLLTLLLAFTATASALKSQPRHDGKSHKHIAPAAVPQQLAQRDIYPNSPVQGLGILSPPPGAISSAPASTLQNSISSTTPSNQTTPIPSNFPSNLFPETVIQIPIATVCPSTPTSSATLPIFSLSPFSSNTLSYSTTNTTKVLANSTSPFSLPANATTSPPHPTAMARIILDSNGCQTLFSPTTTTICQTTLYLPGIGPSRVTDCAQWVTFSSDARHIDGCSSTTTNLPSFTAGPNMITYYAAPWYDLLIVDDGNGVPSLVRVEDCPLTQTCMTSSESWTLSSVTSIVTQITTLAFQGPVAVAAANATKGTPATTAMVSFNSTMTTTSQLVIPTIVRERIGMVMGNSTDEEGTVTIRLPLTTDTTRTILLNEVVTTSTMTMSSTVTVMRTVTRTRASSIG